MLVRVSVLLGIRLADILSRTAVALRGPEPPLTRWSWHDLPELVTALRERVQALTDAADEAKGAFSSLHEDVEQLAQRHWTRMQSGDIPWDAGNDIAGEYSGEFDELRKAIQRATKELDAALTPLPTGGTES